MVAISSSQKKTVFAVAVLAFIAVGVMISGSGGFSGLRSDAFNNPSFVCSEETQTAGKAKYDGAEADIQKFSAEKTGLEKQTQSWSSEIRKNEALLKKFTSEKKTAEKTERTLEVYIKKNCGPRSVANCPTKKKDLQKIQQEIKKIQNSLVNVNAQNSQIRKNMQGAESSIKLLEKQIKEIKNFKGDYETCKRALEKPIITSFSPEVGSVGTIITIYGSRFTSLSTVLIGDNVIDLTPTVVSPDGDWLKISFPRTALENFPADLYSLRVSNVGNVSVNSGLASNSVLFRIKNGEVGIAEFEVIAPGEVFVNEPFDMTVKALDASGKIYDKYEGKIFFDTNNNAADVVFPFQENDKGSEYQFNLSDGGIHTFQKGFTIKKAGTYQLVVFELDSPKGGTEKMVQVVVKERASPAAICGNGIREGAEQCDDGNTNNDDSCDNACKNVATNITCTDNDNGYDYYIKGQTLLSNGVVGTDFCSSANTLDEYICPTTPSEWGVSQTYTCPYGCSEGACNTPPAPVCVNLIVTPTSVVNGGSVTYTCSGSNATSYSVVGRRPDGSVFVTSTSAAGAIIVPASPLGTYTVSCFINGQTTTPAACQKTVMNTSSGVPSGSLTLSLDSSTPLSRLLLDNTSEHSLGVFRLTAGAEESLDVDSINIENWGLGKNGVKFYKFYDGSNLIATSAPDANGNVQLYLPDGTLIIPANDYKLITVKALLYDINGTTFSNEDTISIVAMGAKATGRSSGKTINSMSPNIEANVMLAFEAYPIVSFAADTSIGSTINLGSNQLIAKIALTNPGNKDVTFQSGDGNNFSIQIQVVGDDTDADIETISLRDQDGRSLELSSITSATGITRIDFGMLLRDPNIGTTIPAGQTKYFYIYADTSDLEDNDDIVQVWLDDSNTNNLSFGINGVGNYSIGNIIFRGDLFGPVISRSF